ncbi:MAG: hypothetical protein ACKVWV_05015 [Planctomycetota bacterium]
MRLREHDSNAHAKARAAIYGAVSMLLAMVWHLAIVPREERFVPEPLFLTLMAFFAATTMAIAWVARPLLARSSVVSAGAFGAIVPFVGALILGELMAIAMWLADPGYLHFFDAPVFALRIAIERIALVVPLGIASILVLRTVLVVGRRAGDVQAHSR